MQRDAKLRYSLVGRSRIPLDGVFGLVLILFTAGVLIAFDLDLFFRETRGRATNDDSFVVTAIALNVGALCMIGWVIAVRATNRRARRRLSGGCVWCGYDLRGNTSGRCPECGREVLK